MRRAVLFGERNMKTLEEIFSEHNGIARRAYTP